ncbi:MAG: phosphomethylpyrimidine kinase [Desulfuromonas sp.]|nr:MAG: phosphomethylpyrimidine kinase [Desulfuromonas sp.]
MEGVYLITDSTPDGLFERTEAALKGGTKTLQYRDKQSPFEQKVSMAKEMKELCRRYDVCFIINDSPELAVAVEADGLHLGQQDMPISDARKILGHSKIIGISTRTIEQAHKAERDGADYIAVGSMFTTGSKADAELVGPERLREIRKAVDKPIVAIGGIDRSNVSRVIDAGADAVAIISAVMEDSNPALAAREINLAFNRNKPYPNGKVLTIAGSDSGGGAGIQADLKTITLFGGYGMSAITALTSQNSLGVNGIHPCPPGFVADQINVVLDDFGADTIKTGMLFSSEIVELVANHLRDSAIPAVVDPVMIAKGGAPLLKPAAIAAVKNQLIPVTYLLTPNLPETEALVGYKVNDQDGMEQAAKDLQQMGARHVLIKGGHLEETADDLLLAGSRFFYLPSQRLETNHTHGTGCSYSAAITTLLAQGNTIEIAVKSAKHFIHEAIRTAPGFGSGHGPINHWCAKKFVEVRQKG